MQPPNWQAIPRIRRATTRRARARVDDYIRPCHDLRHSSITNAAAAGTPPEALMSRAGHSSYSTTRRYIDLAGERFRDEADRLERRLWAGPVPETGTKSADDEAKPKTRRGLKGLGQAAGEGFEPSEARTSTVFNTAPFDRSGTPPHRA